MLRRAGERVLAAPHESAQQVGDGQVGSCLRLGLLGQLADHRQHRPLDRLAHGAVGRVARRAERPRERERVDHGRVAHDLGEAADDLGEDHARVAARAHQRRARDLVGEPVAVVHRRAARAPPARRGRSGSGSCRCPRREPGRRSGRRCGCGWPPERRRSDRRARRIALEIRRCTRSCRCLHGLDVHLDGRDLEAGHPPDLVGDAVADRRRDLGEVEAVLDDDVQRDRQPVLVAGDLDTACRPVARQQPAEPAPSWCRRRRSTRPPSVRRSGRRRRP